MHPIALSAGINRFYDCAFSVGKSPFGTNAAGVAVCDYNSNFDTNMVLEIYNGNFIVDVTTSNKYMVLAKYNKTNYNYFINLNPAGTASNSAGYPATYLKNIKVIPRP